MIRFRSLAVATTVATFVLIALGGLVRATDSGLGCPDWPRCFGRLVPPPNAHAWIEHTHRLAASVVIVLVIALAVMAIVTRQPRVIRWSAVAAVWLVLLQALFGALVIWHRLSADSVTLHLGTALGVVALAEFIAFRSRPGVRTPGGPESRHLPSGLQLQAYLTAGVLYIQMLLGSTVTGHEAGLAYRLAVIWPDLGVSAARIQFAHRLFAMVVGVAVIALWWRIRSLGPSGGRTLGRLAHLAAGLVLLQIALGVANVANRLSALTVTPHLAVGSLLWGTLVGICLHTHDLAGATGAPAPVDTGTNEAHRKGFRETISAYVALTKPRIIELLLVTTVPAMFLAERGVPSLWLVAATLVGGTLSAASANVINCWFDRDIDERMQRTANRPLAAHTVDPRSALLYGIVLGIAGFVWLTVLVNLLAAVLATAAILFYVFVYTVGLKRRTTQNIVIGGAAGAVPVLVGWVAVRGRIEIPALVLFAIIFYWTPPHFWALSMRYVADYRAAGVPMLPVVRGDKVTSYQILLYTLVLVALTMLMIPAARMGAVYLLVAAPLGLAFIWQAVRLWRDTSSRRAIRLFHFSNSYLALLFAAVAADAVLHIVL